MIISEKQIMNLISIANMYRSYLIETKLNESLSAEGANALAQTAQFLSEIYNQQSEELKPL